MKKKNKGRDLKEPVDPPSLKDQNSSLRGKKYETAGRSPRRAPHAWQSHGK